MIRLARNPAVTETRLDDEIFLVEPHSDEVYYLDAVSSGLWRLLDGPATLEELQATWSYPTTERRPDRRCQRSRRAVCVVASTRSVMKLRIVRVPILMSAVTRMPGTTGWSSAVGPRWFRAVRISTV
jgi:hypothetical protein